jgi:LysM repeat protein
MNDQHGITMKNILNRKFLLLISAALVVTAMIILVFFVLQNRTDDQSAPSGAMTALLNEIQGSVQTIKQSQGVPEEAYNGQEILEGDQVRTEEDSLARLDLFNGTIVRLGPQSVFTLQKLESNQDGPFAQFKMEIGEIWVILKSGMVVIDTPSGVAAVRGSYLHVHIIKKTGEVIFTCLEGNCNVGNTSGSVDLVAGQKAVITNYSLPPKPGLMDPTDVSNWLLNNPEATLVMVPLTATVGALPEEPPPVKPPDPDWCPDTTGWVSINVQPGDTLASLAMDHGFSPYELTLANCLELTSDLEPGAVIYLPPFLLSATPSPTFHHILTLTVTPTNTPTPAVRTTTPTPSTTSSPPVIPSITPTYRLSPTKCTRPTDWGDTLYDLALPHGITSAELQSANCLISTVIYVGQELHVPPTTPTPTKTPTSTYTITVTSTITATPTETLTPTITSTTTNTATSTATNTATSTATNTATSTATNTATSTSTATNAATSD